MFAGKAPENWKLDRPYRYIIPDATGSGSRSDSGAKESASKGTKIMRASQVAIVVAAIIGGGAFLAACFGTRGDGKITTEKREVPAFKGVEMSGSGILRLHRGAFKVEVTTDANIQSFVLSEVSGGRLRLGLKPNSIGVWPTKLEFDVCLPDLEDIAVSGSGDVFADAFSGEELSCRVSGSGQVSGDFDYRKFDTNITGSGEFLGKGEFDSVELKLSGSGRIGLEGASRDFLATISGSGRVDAKDLKAKTAHVRISGSGSMELSVEDRLEAELSGSGGLRYWGDPELDSHVSGAGAIHRVGE